MMNFDPVVDPEKLQTGTNRRMVDIAIVCDLFNLRLDYPAMMFKEGR